MSLSRSHKGEPEPKVEINVVPLVDVALVLLIIFMVTATFVRSAGMRLQLPTSAVAQVTREEQREVVIGIDPRGTLSWGGAPIDDARLAEALRDEAARYGTRSRVIVQGDTRAEHGRVVQAMTLAQQAGFTQLVIAARRDATR